MIIPPLKDDYRLANCCNPVPGDDLIGFLKYDSTVMSVHRADCLNLAKVEMSRLVKLTWQEIIKDNFERPIGDEPDYNVLDDIDFKILHHHMKMGRDYAAVVARLTGIERATVFDRHKKLRDMNLLTRVKALMMRYRKGIVDNKWVKHRNHTYYELTSRGLEYIEYYQKQKDV